jgi:hypothetical protein
MIFINRVMKITLALLNKKMWMIFLVKHYNVSVVVTMFLKIAN